MASSTKGLQWYPKYVGDYARKTKSLSLIEHGAFQVLLDHYYATAEPLPSISSSCRPSTRSSTVDLIPDHTRIYRICGAITKVEQDAVDYILDEFFYMDELGNYRQKRADEIIAEQAEKHGKAVERGRNAVAARERKRGKKPSKFYLDDDRQDDLDDHQADKSKITNQNQNQNQKDLKNIKKDFDEWFAVYPKQLAQKRAFEVWQVIKDQLPPMDELLDITKTFAAENKGNEKFVPNGSTWLKESRWNETKVDPSIKPIDTSDFLPWQKDIAEVKGVSTVINWFKDAELNVPDLFVANEFKQQWIENNFQGVLNHLGVENVIVRLTGSTD